MESENHTRVGEFLLLGLSEDPDLQPLLFGVFLSMYLVTVFGNLLIILAVSSDSYLHTPMYFFLSNLSFTDICFSSTKVPKMILDIQTEHNTISYTGCLSQISFALTFGGMENFLLAVMAYDRYVAICNPLRYTVILSPHLCVLLIVLSVSISIVDALLHSLMVLQLSFCTDLTIPNIFCELAQLIKLACSDTLISTILVYVVVGILAVVCLTEIIFSYVKIFSSILRMHSARAKYKAFSTCASHLSIVSLFYGAGFEVYSSSEFTSSSSSSAIASLMCTVVPILMNPFLYSVRNRDVKEALKKIIRPYPFVRLSRVL
ncbi:olfactory receptor 7G2 [Fukomys damarensis]|uniref:Olfactory receptor n=1 Tax=Fukomys damarensis TaxID=885580 RepID=A0A091DU69_FUKDA|nr:olfactory receptor 7G2 [Fukomys damarensis]KFO34038.1 Olfactory receptor 7G3 [Fukomys damarensis]